MDSTTAMSIVLRPLALFVLLVAAVYLSRLIGKVIPEGRVKRVLYARHTVIPEGPVSPRVMWACRGIVVLVVLIIVFKPFRYF